MPTLEIHETVAIKAPLDRVWSFLLDPARVVECLPGATYDGAESDTVFLGHIKVKVGPVSTQFAGKATMSEVDAEAHRVRILGEGKDKNGAGTARLELTGHVSQTETGSSLSVDAAVDLTGKLVTFGRGLIASVSQQLFKQFAASAREKLEAEPAPAPASTPTSDPAALAADAPTAAAATTLAPKKKEAQINGLSLLFRALGSSIARFFGRLFRRKRA